MTQPAALTLASFGSFTIGGRRAEVQERPPQVVSLSRDLPDYAVDPNGTYAIEHAYVQYFIPEPASQTPVLFMHGGGMTGSCWENTPDGREGWLQHFLRAGHPAYVVDGVERGRAGWCPVPGLWHEASPLLRTEQEAWDAFRIGPSSGYPGAVPFQGCLFPIENLEQLTRQQVPRWTTTTAIAVAALVELIRRIGLCIIIAHSQGGGIAAAAAAETAGMLDGLVLIEPHGLPEPERFSDPSDCPQLVVAGDFIDQSPMYQGLRDRWFTYLDGLHELGVHTDYLDLPNAGHPGNSHMIMMDRNSDEIATVVRSRLSVAPHPRSDSAHPTLATSRRSR